MKRANSTNFSGIRRMPDLAAETSKTAVRRSMVYAAIGFCVLLPNLPGRAFAQSLALQVPSAQTDTAPAAVSINGIDYVAWTGKNNTAAVWYSTSTNNGATWASQQNFSKYLETPPSKPYQTKYAPALAAVGSTVYLAWTDATTDPGNILYSVCNSSSPCTPYVVPATATSWGEPTQPNCKGCTFATKAAPALAANNAALYMAWTTAGGTIDVASYTGASWAPLAGAQS